LKVKVLFPHKLKSKPIEELVERYRTFAARLAGIELSVGAYADKNGRALPQLLERVSQADSVYLSERAAPVESHWFKEALEASAMSGRTLLFVVGAADGIPPEMEAACKRKISLTRLTLPHEMALLILMEQLWRATSMIRGHPYHR